MKRPRGRRTIIVDIVIKKINDPKHFDKKTKIIFKYSTEYIKTKQKQDGKMMYNKNTEGQTKPEKKKRI